jgi:tetratricopeptide (TPR) repeat protein
MAHDVFISYSARDRAVADRVCAALERRPLRCWIAPRDITPGAEWSEAIVDAIAGSRVVVLIVSSHSNGSDQVKREAELSVARRRPIIPLRIEETPLNKSLEYFLGTCHWLDAWTPPLEQHLACLTETIEQLLADRAEVTPALVYRSARAATEEVLARLTREGVFRPEVYAARTEAQSQVAAFQDSSAPALLLLGGSGMGKTCLAAALASEWLAHPNPGRVVLLLSAATLPAGPAELTAAVAAQLGLTRPLEEATAHLEATAGRDGGLRVLVVLDGLERHPDPVAAMHAVEALARCFRRTRSFRLLATCTLAVLETLCRAGVHFDRELFYQPSKGIVADPASPRPPGLVLGPLSEDELAVAYERYRQQPGTAPATPFAELTEEARRVLANPIFLRIAAEVFDGRPVTAPVFSGVMLREYVAKKVFTSPARRDFVSALVDLMLRRGQRALALQELLEHPRLRPAVLDDTSRSVFVQLRDEQILTTRTQAVPDGLPLPPEEFVEFRFERLLEYLLLWRLVGRHGDSRTALARALEGGRDYPPLREAALLLLLHLTRAGILGPLADLFAREDDWTKTLLRDVFVELFERDPAKDGEASGAEVARGLAQSAPAVTAAVVASAGETLFVRGRWDSAHAAVAATTDLPGLDPRLVAGQRNRLVLLCKNMDRWPEALRHSDACWPQLPELPPDLQARLCVNRGSVLYDMGDRPGAADLFRQALHQAGGAGCRLELAAAANNLGLYHLYHDELKQAEVVLRQGLDALGGHPVGTAYLETNLGLVLLTQALAEPDVLREAEQVFAGVVEGFTNAGHLQGISYAVSNRALCDLARGRWDEARSGFEQTIRLAGQLGEKWSAYGARANLALLQLLRPGGDPRAAWDQARASRAAARANNDPKGVADATLIAARAALDLAARGEADPALLEAARDLLTEARALFARLGQRLGEAQACFGLAELLRHGPAPDRAADWERRGREALAQTSLGGLPARLPGLPWHMLLLMELF